MTYSPDWNLMFSRTVRNIAPPDFPTIVVLCGSTRFGEAFAAANKSETLAGKIVLSVGMLGHAEGIDMGGPIKTMLDELHKRKIELANSIFVISDEAGYIGLSTRSEIDYAKRIGKLVRWMYPAAEVTYDALAQGSKAE